VAEEILCRFVKVHNSNLGEGKRDEITGFLYMNYRRGRLEKEDRGGKLALENVGRGSQQQIVERLHLAY